MHTLEKNIKAVEKKYKIQNKEVYERATERMARLSSKGFIKPKPFEIDIHRVSGYGSGHSMSNMQDTFLYQL